MTYDNIFCQFITNDGDSFECINCGLKIKTLDGSNPPLFPCKNSFIRVEKDTDLSFINKIKNFASSTVNHIVNGLPECSEEQILNRYKICIKCEYYKENVCQKCGCPLIRNKKFISKLAWADQECPIGKWSKEI